MYRILSLDGGGVRGLMTVTLLARLATRNTPDHGQFDGRNYCHCSGRWRDPPGTRFSLHQRWSHHLRPFSPAPMAGVGRVTSRRL